jgi:hypothetical protein
MVHVAPCSPIPKVWQLSGEPVLHGKHAPKILHIEVAAQSSEGGVVTLAFEGMFLQGKQSALHPKL